MSQSRRRSARLRGSGKPEVRRKQTSLGYLPRFHSQVAFKHRTQMQSTFLQACIDTAE